MRRWTDGKSWSASRVSGSFLTYREMEGKRGGGVSTSRSEKTPDSRGGNSDDDRDGSEDGPDGYRYKPDGLMKQSFSITTSTGQHLHLISYYARSHPTAPNFNQPSTDPNLRHIRPQKGLYPESTVNDQTNLPMVTRGPMPGTMTLASPHMHMAGYPRNGATHPQSYGPSLYSWPPTPSATPPTATVPYHSGPGYLPPLAGAAPVTPYGQPMPSHPQAPSAGHPASHHSLPTPSERALHLETTLPPPLSSSTVSAPTYHGTNHSPRPGPLASETHGIHSPNYALKPNLAGQMDPRLMSPRSQKPAGPNNDARIYSTQPLTPNHSHLPPTHTDIRSTGTTVPSIVSLMNGPTTSPYTKGGGSPASLRVQGPQDIPSDKIGFGGEDMRAIRQLDRVFIA